MENFEENMDKIVEGLKRPIPADPKLITERAIWFALSCSKKCVNLKNQFRDSHNLKLTIPDGDQLFLEMVLLVIASGLDVIKMRFKKEFSKGDSILGDVYDEDAEEDFMAVSKNGKDTSEATHLKDTIRRMKGTDIMTYEIKEMSP